MPNTVRIVSSNDVLQVDAGGVVNLDGGSLRASDITVIPPPSNTPDDAVLKAKKGAPGGVVWDELPAVSLGLSIEITDPQDGDVLVYDAKAGVWRNKQLGLSEGT